jgi:hypothetical protein
MRIVDGLDLDDELRALLRPGRFMADEDGRLRRLPRFFYLVESFKRARQTELTAHFTLNEFLNVDVREAAPLREWPRYVPCAVTVLAAHLELFRLAVGVPVHLAANGGYRSPAHARAGQASTHCWAAAADVFQVGTELLDERLRIEKFARIAAEVAPSVWVKPYAEGDDHLHLELGHVVLVPRGASGEEAEEGGR